MGLTFEVEDAPDRTIPEDKIVRARLNDITTREFTFDSRDNPGTKETARKLQFWWEVQSPDEYQGRKVRLETDARLTNHPRNKFRMIAETLLGRELPPGMKIDVDDLTGLSADITIKHVKDRKDPSKIYEEVDEVMPISGGFAVSDKPPF